MYLLFMYTIFLKVIFFLSINLKNNNFNVLCITFLLYRCITLSYHTTLIDEGFIEQE